MLDQQLRGCSKARQMTGGTGSVGQHHGFWRSQWAQHPARDSTTLILSLWVYFKASMLTSNVQIRKQRFNVDIGFMEDQPGNE